MVSNTNPSQIDSGLSQLSSVNFDGVSVTPFFKHSVSTNSVKGKHSISSVVTMEGTADDKQLDGPLPQSPEKQMVLVPVDDDLSDSEIYIKPEDITSAFDRTPEHTPRPTLEHSTDIGDV